MSKRLKKIEARRARLIKSVCVIEEHIARMKEIHDRESDQLNTLTEMMETEMCLIKQSKGL